jgi:hypothetical protein
MSLRLDGSRVLLTGASSGIGAELARLLAPRVAHLALVALPGPALEAVAVELRQRHPALVLTTLPCDLSDAAALEALGAQGLGEVDVLINCAGAGDSAFFAESTWATTERLTRLNALAPAWLMRRLLPGMLARGHGGVLNVSSGFGLTSLPTLGSYVATKHFLSGLTETVRAEVDGTGVVVTQCCPGPVATGFEAAVGRPMHLTPPGFLVITAARCAREALHGFEAGRALVVPSRRMQLIAWLVEATPRWLRTRLQAAVARRLRALRR